jgi:hypothetical protein
MNLLYAMFLFSIYTKATLSESTSNHHLLHCPTQFQSHVETSKKKHLAPLSMSMNETHRGGLRREGAAVGWKAVETAGCGGGRATSEEGRAAARRQMRAAVEESRATVAVARRHDR